MLVRLRAGAPGTFHRSVFDKDGEVVEVLEFQPGQARVLSKRQVAAVARDLELGTLEECGLDGAGNARSLAELAALQRAAEATPSDEGTAHAGAADGDDGGEARGA